jgi:hypothetical protein
MAAWCFRFGAAAINRPHLLGAQDDGQLAQDEHVLHLGHQIGLAQRDVEEELQFRDGRVDCHRAGAGVHEVQSEAPNFGPPPTHRRMHYRESG